MKSIYHNFGSNIRIYKKGFLFPNYRLEIDTKSTPISESETILDGTHTSWHKSIGDIKSHIRFQAYMLGKSFRKVLTK